MLFRNNFISSPAINVFPLPSDPYNPIKKGRELIWLNILLASFIELVLWTQAHSYQPLYCQQDGLDFLIICFYCQQDGLQLLILAISILLLAVQSMNIIRPHHQHSIAFFQSKACSKLHSAYSVKSPKLKL